MFKKIGFIPLRKGSKDIRNKYKKKMAGRPLFSWVLTEALFSNLDEMIVYTDDREIVDYIAAEYTWTSKIKVVMRSVDSATDTVSIDDAMTEYCESINYGFDVFCLLQSTSPLTSRIDINNCLSKVNNESFDSSLTVVRTQRLLWNEDGTPANYDYLKRPSQHDVDRLLMENGAVYAAKADSIKQNNNRLGGKIGLVEMPEETLIQLGTTSDWGIVENLLIDRLRLQKTSGIITHLILDVDGVFTDGCVYVGSEGELMKKFDMRDGMGLEILRQHDVEVIVMTSENSKLVEQRMKKLKIDKAYFGIKDKYAFLQNLLVEQNLQLGNLAYIGDDINDLASMLSVGWSFAPNNAMDIIKRNADFTVNADSAAGAIRTVCDHIMKYNRRFSANG
ncbi:MAG TPA: HAD hydrolase family protein [Flavobacterium sp.]|jgi:N-acylneuraminate cytidylyltransferase